MRKIAKNILSLLIGCSLIAGSAVTAYGTAFSSETVHDEKLEATAIPQGEGKHELEGVKPLETPPLKSDAPNDAINTTLSRASYRSANENAKVGFAIGEIENDKLVGIGQSTRQYWVDESINAAVDLDISGDGVKYENPVVRIKVKKSDVITEPDFAASINATKSELVADKDYYIFEHTFTVLTGGQHLTFPLPYKFNPSTNVKDGDKSTVVAEFFTRDADGGKENLIKTSEKTYIAKVAQIKTHLQMWDASAYKFEYEDKDTKETPIHYQNIYVNANDKDKTRMSPGTQVRYIIWPYQYIDLPEGVTGRKGYTYPKNITFKITFADGIIKSGTGLQSDKKTMIVTTPTMSWSDTYNDKPAWYKSFDFLVENAKLNENIRYDVKYYINYGGKDQQEIQPSRHGYIHLTPQPFTMQGNFSIENSGYAHISYPERYYAGVPYGLWSRASNYYSYMNGSLFYRSNNADKAGMIQRYHFRNGNNGGSAGQETKARGIITKVKELTAKFTSEGEYFKALNLAAEDNKVIDQLNQTNNTVYGIKQDGTKVQIAKNVKNLQRVELNDAARNYVALNVVFDTPITLDNNSVSLVTYTHLTQTELNKFKNKEYKEAQVYKTHATAKVQTGQEPFAEEKYTIADSNDEYGYHAVSPVQPVVNEFQEDNKVVTYQKGGTPFTHRVGPRIDGNNDSSHWGDIKKVGHVQTVTLLPTGVAYEKYDKYGSDTNDTVKVRTVENYKNTGKTAVIVDYRDLVIKDNNYTNDLVILHLRATKNVKRGDNIIETYMTYDTNDIVKPYNKNLAVADKLDLDSDGNKDEEFMLVKRVITYVPALELILHKDVIDHDGNENTTSNNFDLNDKINYAVSLFNNSLVPVRKVSVIDKLPFVGDKTIVPNDQGTYADRGSKFAITLRDFVENAKENEKILEDFDVYYEIKPSNGNNNTIETIRDGEWKQRKDMQTSDLSKVKNIKFVLKQGHELAPKKEAKFIIPALMPSDTNLAKAKDPQFSVGTAAFSTDGIGYNEGNNAQASFHTYSVDGKVYEDKNSNGIFDKGDAPINNATVELVDEAGNIAFSFKDHGPKDQKELKGLTDDQGNYHFNVYSRGKYTVRVTNPHKYYEFNTQQATAEQVKNNAGNNITVEAVNTAETKPFHKTGKSVEFMLNPETPQAIHNAALLRKSFTLRVAKVWTQGSTPQEKAYFVLEVKDGNTWKPFNTDTMNFENKVYEISKNANGEFKVSLEISAAYIDHEIRVVETDKNGKKATESHDNDKSTITLNNTQYYAQVSGDKKSGFTISNEQKYRLRYVVIPDAVYGKPKDSASPNAKSNITYNSKETLNPKLETSETKVTTKDGKQIQGKWTFTGWSTNKDDIASSIVTQLAITKDVSVYGKWEFNPHKDIQVIKQWKNYDGKAIADADKGEVKVQLYKNGEAIEKPLVLNADNNWTATFKNLEIATKAGEKPHKYEVKEVGVDAKNDIKIQSSWFKASVVENKNGSVVVTNTKYRSFTPMLVPTRNISVVKQWLNSSGTKLLDSIIKNNEITVQLYRVDGQQETKIGKAVKLNDNNHFSHIFDKLPVSDTLGGKAIRYIVKEEGVQGGKITLGFLTYASQTVGNMNDGFTINNILDTSGITIEEPKQSEKKSERKQVLSKQTDRQLKELVKTGVGTNKTIAVLLMLASALAFALVAIRNKNME